MGVGLAVDDFGTGYSSLTRLRLVPVDQVKIDQTFVSAIDDATDDRHGRRPAQIVEAVAAIAGALDLETTAEGVESAEQLAYLRRLGCDYGQGYYFAKPLMIDELGALLDADPRW